MKKVLIIGIVASGKTTLAKRLSQKMNIPSYELDGIVHPQTPDGRYKRTADEQVEVIREIDKSGAWIFEGTDRESYQCLFDMATPLSFSIHRYGNVESEYLPGFLSNNWGLKSAIINRILRC
ncbi:EutP/PduV family microcompartment system protein [Paenibacillus elgii]|uniref:EutP/PduV family microcompartment system protein n=1 Tax=Paenibacillus elgii TaxID=189691 RepID=UPI001CB8B834|nr:EutP/PduV family microcompartment system protein [Paenibacillus elgii]